MWYTGCDSAKVLDELHDKDYNCAPNAVVDGLIDDLRDVRSIGRPAYACHHKWVTSGNQEIGNEQVAYAS